MKTLIILRHGKAESAGKESTATDHPRTLTPKGRQEAATAGQTLAERGMTPDLIVASDARRAYQTATLAAAELPQAAPLHLDPAIYDAGLDTLLHVVQQLPDDADRVVLVGHNPGFESLADALGGGSAPLPTGGLVCLTFNVKNWANVREGAGTVVWRAG